MTTKQRQIIHLMNRAAFGPSPVGLEKMLQLSLPEVIDHLFDSSKEFSALQAAPIKKNSISLKHVKPLDRKKRLKQLRVTQQKLNLEWLDKMAFSPGQLREKMAFFWHDHFACFCRFPALIQKQINTIREHALGYFGDLVLEITKDPAMIIYLNNKENVKGKPNENFGRELLELFTLGVGHYSEQDIKEAARAFTGWRFHPQSGDFFIDKEKHDFGKKTFLGKTAYFSGEDIINIIFENPRSGEYIVEKLYYYLSGQKIDEQQRTDLSRLFYESNYHIGTLVRAILTEETFYDENKMSKRVKSPVELLVGIMRLTQLHFSNSVAAVNIQRKLGQELFVPPDVSGWVSGKAWLDLSTISERLNLTRQLLTKGILKNNIRKQISTESIELIIPKNEQETLTKVQLNSMLHLLGSIAPGQKATFLSDILYIVKHKNLSRWIKKLDERPLSSTLDVKKLMIALMSRPEYQLN